MEISEVFPFSARVDTDQASASTGVDPTLCQPPTCLPDSSLCLPRAFTRPVCADTSSTVRCSSVGHDCYAAYSPCLTPEGYDLAFCPVCSVWLDQVPSCFMP
ncbi:hypothetical protein Pcinc_008097 [Petrolisthes cinctipes]|uniref:Uncharacterized protein n=1 Tax=Petrolisthes cinctipes TaxID=88211 RepID=A0AAE1G766_PETCI|nr:hypothetical protein Pcinc_008097 [Petrolisthes cinctipes]